MLIRSIMKCPNIKDKDYQRQAAVLGGQAAQEMWLRNNGQPLWLTPEGEPSKVFEGLKNALGFFNAMQAMRRAVGRGIIVNDTVTNKKVLDALIQHESMKDNNPRVVLAQMRQEATATSRALDEVVSSIQKAVPGLVIHRETSLTAEKKGVDRSLAGWVDNEGYHINIDHASLSTPIHEFSHVFMALVRARNPKLYSEIQDLLDDYINSSQIVPQIKAKWLNRDEAVLRDELIAQVAGSASVEKIKQYMVRNGIAPSDDVATKEYNNTRSFFEKIWNAIRTAIKNVFGQQVSIDSDNTLQHFFSNLTQSFLDGNGMNIDYDVMTALRDGLAPILSDDTPYLGFNENMVDEAIAEGMVKRRHASIVRGTADIPKALINNDDPTVFGGRASNWANNQNTFSEMVSRRAYTPMGSKVTYIEWMGKRFEFPVGLSKIAFHERIIADILPHHNKQIESFPSNIREIMEKNITSDRDLLDIIEDTFSDDDGNIRVDKFEVKRLVELAGGNDNVEAIMKLSELRTNAKYAKLGQLIDISTLGSDPTVVIHKAENGEFDISISDINTGDMSFDGVRTGRNRKLGARFMNDIDNPIKTNAWTNSKMDVQAAALVYTIASIKHKAEAAGVKVRIRRSGVYGISGGGKGRLRAKTIFDYKDAFHQVRSVLQHNGMQDLITNEYMKEVINDDKAWDHTDMTVSHLFELQSYYSNENLYENLSTSMRDAISGDDKTKSERIAAIRRRMNYLSQHYGIENARRDYEYQLLAKTVVELKSGWHTSTMNFNDMANATKNILNPHNVGNSIVQYASLEMEAAKQKVLRKANQFEKEINALIKEVQRARGLHTSRADEIFNRMYPEIDVIADKEYPATKEHEAIKAGQTVRMKLYNEIYHHNYPNKELIRSMLASNAITEEELNLGDFIIKNVKDLYVMSKYEKGFRNSSKYTMADAIKDVNAEYTENTIPVLPATQMQLLRGMHMKEWFKNLGSMLSKGDIMYGDLTTERFGNIGSTFDSQISREKQLANMGIIYENGQYHAYDIEMMYMQSNNLEYTIKFFNLETHRNAIFNRDLVPMYNELKAVAAYAKTLTGTEMVNAEKYLDEYYQYIVNRKHKDDYATDALTKRAAPIVRGLLALNTFVSIGYRPVTWIKSMFYNEQNSLIGALATKAANWGAVTNEVDLPSPGDFHKAHELMFTELKKSWRIAERFQIINNQERDILENMDKNITDKHFAKRQIAHWGNHYGDAASRTMTLLAFMIHDGSYDAYSYDAQQDEVFYDPKKDRRFFNEDGTYKEGMEAVHNTIIADQIEQGLVDMVDGKRVQAIGYDFVEINKRIKWYADKYIIGAMDPNQKTMLGNQWMGAALGQFKTFMWDKLWNMGYGQITTEYGGKYVPIKDKNGEWVAVREQMLIEGQMRSLVEAIKTFKDVINKDKKWWADMPPMRRRNLMETGLRTMMLLAFLSAFAMLTDDDDEKEEREKFIREVMRRNKDLTRDEAMSMWKKKSHTISDADKRKLNFLWGDIFLGDTMTSFYNNPLPLFRTLIDVYELAVGKNKAKRLIRFVGPAKDAVWFYSLIGIHDDPWDGDLSTKEKERRREEREKEKRLEEAE